MLKDPIHGAAKHLQSETHAQAGHGRRGKEAKIIGLSNSFHQILLIGSRGIKDLQHQRSAC